MQYIYGLQDPIDKQIKYVGKSNAPERRLLQHISTNEDTTKGRWIQSLRLMGKQPSVVILAACEDDQVFYHEQWWITLGRQQGWKLTNTNNPTSATPDFSGMFSEQLKTEFQSFVESMRQYSKENAPMIMVTRRQFGAFMLATGAIIVCAIALIVGYSAGQLEYSATSSHALAIAMSIPITYMALRTGIDVLKYGPKKSLVSTLLFTLFTICSIFAIGSEVL